MERVVCLHLVSHRADFAVASAFMLASLTTKLYCVDARVYFLLNQRRVEQLVMGGPRKVLVYLFFLLISNTSQ